MFSAQDVQRIAARKVKNIGLRTDRDKDGYLTLAARKYNQWLANKRWRERNKEKWDTISKTYKLKRYHELEKYSEAYKLKKKARAHRYYLKHKEQMKAYQAAYKAKDPEKFREIRRRSARKHGWVVDYKGNRCLSCTSVVAENMLFCNWCHIHNYAITR